MRIKIIAVGRIKERYLKEGIAEYMKRLGAYCKIEIIEVEDEKINENASQAEEELVKNKEKERIIKYLKPDTYLIALDLRGKALSSEELSGHLDKLALQGKSDLSILVGGSLGLHQTLIESAQLRLSFSKMTFPHQLMRLILVEQLYRAFKISRSEPYHK